MTCPAGWREAAMRRYVEAEFSSAGVRVHGVVVRQPPPGAAATAVVVVADVLLDYRMGPQRLGEAIEAMLAAPPKAVGVLRSQYKTSMMDMPIVLFFIILILYGIE